jgi:hypothetical protein
MDLAGLEIRTSPFLRRGEGLRFEDEPGVVWVHPDDAWSAESVAKVTVKTLPALALKTSALEVVQQIADERQLRASAIYFAQLVGRPPKDEACPGPEGERR